MASDEITPASPLKVAKKKSKKQKVDDLDFLINVKNFVEFREFISLLSDLVKEVNLRVVQSSAQKRKNMASLDTITHTSDNTCQVEASFMVDCDVMKAEQYDVTLKLSEIKDCLLVQSNCTITMWKNASSEQIKMGYRHNGKKPYEIDSYQIYDDDTIMNGEKRSKYPEDRYSHYKYDMDIDVKILKNTFKKYKNRGSKNVTISMVKLDNQNAGLQIYTKGDNNWENTKIFHDMEQTDDDDFVEDRSVKVNAKVVVKSEFQFGLLEKIVKSMSNETVNFRVDQDNPLIIKYKLGDEDAHIGTIDYFVGHVVEDTDSEDEENED